MGYHIPFFSKSTTLLDSVNSHIEQVEFGTKAWNQIFVSLTKKVREEKLKRFGKNGELYISPSTGLIALIDESDIDSILKGEQHGFPREIVTLTEKMAAAFVDQ